MDEDASGWLWLFIDVGMVAILGIAIAYGGMVWRNRSRNKTVEKLRDEATRENFR